MGEVGGDVREVPAEGGVGQAEVAGLSEHGGWLAAGVSEQRDGQLDVFPAGAGLAGHVGSGWWRSRNRVIWSRRSWRRCCSSGGKLGRMASSSVMWSHSARSAVMLPSVSTRWSSTG